MGALSRWEYESEKDAEIEICVALPNASSVTPLIVSQSHLPTPSDLFGPRHSQILGGFFFLVMYVDNPEGTHGPS